MGIACQLLLAAVPKTGKVHGYGHADHQIAAIPMVKLTLRSKSITSLTYNIQMAFFSGVTL
jgi:hypothetical protein